MTERPKPVPLRGLDDIVAEPPQRIAGGAQWSEGPCYLPESDQVIWSDIPGNRILSWSATNGAGVFRTEVEFTNGRYLDREGRIVMCSHGRRAIERENGTAVPDTLAAHYGSARLNSPNDVIVDSHGGIWFTDPPYGIVQPHEGHPGEREYGDNWVFYLAPLTGGPRPVVTDVEEPNGLALSPDETVLYVTDTSAALKAPGEGHRLIRAYDVQPGTQGPTAKNSRVFAHMTRGLADGLRVDIEGRVWTSNGPAISVIAPDGTWLGDIDFPATVGNLCFGGRDGSVLFVACSDSLYRMPTLTQGAGLHWLDTQTEGDAT